MQPLIVALAAFGSALVVIGGYHIVVAGPRLRALQRTLDTHDGLIGGGSATPASRRLQQLEAAAATTAGDRATMGARIAELERSLRTQAPRIGFVRYNAFDDVGSDLSYALALVTPEGDGVVLTSIYSREETRTFGKTVQKFQPTAEASREELAAIAQARTVSA